MDSMRAPRSTAGFCLPVGDALTAWHLTTCGSPAGLDDYQCEQAAYLVAAALRSAAAQRGLESWFIGKVRLDQVVAVIERKPLSALEALPGTGLQDFIVGESKVLGETLMGDFGSDDFTRVQQLAATIVRHHLDDADDPAATLADRSGPVGAHLRQQGQADVADDMGWVQH